MTSKTITIAKHIADSAMDQGLSIEGVRAYSLTTADEDYIRAEYPSEDYPADAISKAEWRSIIGDIEAAVREAV